MTPRTKARRGTIARAALKGMLVVIGAVLAFVAVCFGLTKCSPPWWRAEEAFSADADADRRARELEQNFAAAVYRIRPDNEPWALRIHDTDINDWMAARLPSWTEHDPTLAWPIEGARAQVRFEESMIIVGISVDSRVWSGAFGMVVEPNGIRIDPGAGAVGRMPIPAGAAMVAKLLHGEGASTLRLPRSFALSDGRTIEVRRIDLTPGAIEIECATSGTPPR
ncbi:MAG: hypothetical protein EXS03_05745 [Phycisphaerales bacterium]|nr:hypothetical protein [Phycisphaerales bacterium]